MSKALELGMVFRGAVRPPFIEGAHEGCRVPFRSAVSGGSPPPLH